MKKNFKTCTMKIMLVTCLVMIFSGCENKYEKPPFGYRYTSANLVQIAYLGTTYELSRYGTNPDTPFKFQFEGDGDLDITINGKTYDIDSPYDIDIKKKSTSKKKTTQKKIKKRKTVPSSGKSTNKK